ncbi:hypothetical protein O181_108894 [Austropuccinia psidii MF-1]|uniref:Uncharacterized protein n=1 Tax=Austropuccinia psidii MF-1 TaxID=1389203 RepID=A0A9Q3PPD5_9BASI|nr:hypothetical protein [Austropuccinia psidii MF-1]
MPGVSRVSPHSPRSVPTSFDVNSEPSLIEGSILRAEPFPSGIHKNILVPVQKLVQRIQGRGVGNMPTPLAGSHELLLTHQEPSGSGEDHRALRRPEEGVENDPSFGERRPSGIYQLQKCPKTSPKGPQRKEKGSKNHQGKVKGKYNWHRPYPQGYRIPKL